VDNPIGSSHLLGHTVVKVLHQHLLINKLSRSSPVVYVHNGFERTGRTMLMLGAVLALE
jgi:hypothetical protein